MLITPIKQTIFINNFNLDKKSLICCKKFKEKTKLHKFYKNQNQIENKKIEIPT